MFVNSSVSYSPVFIDILAHTLDGRPHGGYHWYDQVTEKLSSNRDIRQAADAILSRLILSEDAQRWLARVSEYYTDICSGVLQQVQKRSEILKHVCVVGIPRSGGSYLTSELFSALGYEPAAIPPAIAHDGFPDARPFQLGAGANSWREAQWSLSEYLTATEFFFLERDSEMAVIPKKLTKAAYAGGLFNVCLGETTEYYVTVRNPIDCCVSTYEKSGGLPTSGGWRPRSAIERWMVRDASMLSRQPADPADAYFRLYIQYWISYHLELATGGLLKGRFFEVIPFGCSSMHACAVRFHKKWQSDAEPRAFHQGAVGRHRHPEWLDAALSAIDLVANVWESCGLKLPKGEILSDMLR